MSARNLADTSAATIAKMRPDFCLWVNGTLLLKGEHKRNTDELDDAKNDLIKKMNGRWNPVALRGIPFLPCYALAGTLIQFCAIFPTESDSAALKTVSAIYDLSDPKSRVWVMCISLNMLRILHYLKMQLKGPGHSLYKYLYRAVGFVMIMGDFVWKQCTPSCLEVYDHLDGLNPLPCAVNVKRIGCTKGPYVNLEIRPVCLEVQPETEIELKCAVRCVLQALCALHNRGFVHRDVRWPNILKDRTTWRLADFELAAVIGSNLNPVGTAHLPPELVSNPSAPYETSGDIFCVGKLGSAWKGTAPLSAEAAVWFARLAAPNPTDRPSAQSLLDEQGSWLAND